MLFGSIVRRTGDVFKRRCDLKIYENPEYKEVGQINGDNRSGFRISDRGA